MRANIILGAFFKKIVYFLSDLAMEVLNSCPYNYNDYEQNKEKIGVTLFGNDSEIEYGEGKNEMSEETYPNDLQTDSCSLDGYPDPCGTNNMELWQLDQPGISEGGCDDTLLGFSNDGIPEDEVPIC